MSKRQKSQASQAREEIAKLWEDRNKAVRADPIASYVREVEYSPSLIEKAQSLVGDGVSFTLQKLPKQNWIDPRIDPQPIQPQEPTQTHREFAEAIIGKMAESLGVPSPLPDYESPERLCSRDQHA